MAKDLRTVIPPSKVNYFMRHHFKMLSILALYSQKILSCSRFLLYEKMNTNYFHSFVININTFHASECHLNPIQDTNTHSFTFCLIRFLFW